MASLVNSTNNLKKKLITIRLQLFQKIEEKGMIPNHFTGPKVSILMLKPDNVI